MQRIRVRYTKEGRVRFVSARDLTSVWERALRRADLPIAYSEGFHPHAKVSFPDALPVGYASTGEYAELTFAAPVDPGPALQALSATLPPGMDILVYFEVPDGAPKLAKMLEATMWECVLPAPDEAGDAAPAQPLADRINDLCAEIVEATELPVVRRRPKGDKSIDVRPWLADLRASVRPDEAGRPTTILRAIFTNDGPSVRPTELYEVLTTYADGDLTQPRLYRRVSQGRVEADGLTEALSGEHEPLAPNRLVGAA